jgi:aryl-alcohol dehydrogenase-like predicted oxidoreductase
VAAANTANNSSQKPLPKRPLGKTSLNVSIIGMGGIVIRDTEPDYACRIVADAIEKGVNYFDVAPLYGDAEFKLGPALKPFRKDVYIACKTGQRSYAGAAAELKESLRRLETDHFDVYQFHGLDDIEKDVKAALGKDGAIKAFVEAKKAGVIRNIGLSVHRPSAAIMAMNEFDFDTIMFPVNFRTHFNCNLESEVLASAKKRNMGVIGIKAIAGHKCSQGTMSASHPKCWYEPIDDAAIAELALNWALQQDISVTLPPGDENLFKLCLKLAPSCKKLTESQIEQLKKIASEAEAIFTG